MLCTYPCAAHTICIWARPWKAKAYLNDWHLAPKFVPEFQQYNPLLLLQGGSLCTDKYYQSQGNMHCSNHVIK